MLEYVCEVVKMSLYEVLLILALINIELDEIEKELESQSSALDFKSKKY